MLITEWNTDDALAVRFEEGLEEGFEKGREEGREKGLEEGREEGREEGMEIAAKNALVKGLPIEVIHDITGLDIEAIKLLALNMNTWKRANS